MFERYSYRARRVIVVALWSARRRRGSHIEPEDLLHAIVREDRGEFAAIDAEIFREFAAIDAEIFPGTSVPNKDSAGSRLPFFPRSVGRDLLRELHEDTEPLNPETPSEKREPIPHVDVPVSLSLKNVLALVAKAHEDDTKTIEPLDLLAGIVADRDGRLAQLLRHQGITRQNVAKALHSGS